MKSVKTRRSRRTALGAAVAFSMVLAACGGGGGAPGPKNPGGDTIVIGGIGWNEDVAVRALWTRLLEERGYNVEVRRSSPSVAFAGLADDTIDIFMDAWLPTTHKAMMNQYGASLAKIGSWYTNGTLEWTVPSYMQDVDSISDLRGIAPKFDGTITGIEPTAGITATSKDAVIPTYNLGKGYQLHESTSLAMVAALKEAISAGEPIVVTLWHPHVAYSRWDLKDLKDPKGTLGKGQDLWVMSRQHFAQDAPQVAKWLKNFHLSHEQLRQLQHLMFTEYQHDHQKALDHWISNHQDLVDNWIQTGPR